MWRTNWNNASIHPALKLKIWIFILACLIYWQQPGFHSSFAIKCCHKWEGCEMTEFPLSEGNKIAHSVLVLSPPRGTTANLMKFGRFYFLFDSCAWCHQTVGSFAEDVIRHWYLCFRVVFYSLKQSITKANNGFSAWKFSHTALFPCPLESNAALVFFHFLQISVPSTIDTYHTLPCDPQGLSHFLDENYVSS